VSPDPTPHAPSRASRLGLAAFVVTVALGAAGREAFEPRLPEGLLVEVVGDVPRPGVHLVGEATVASAVAAAGGEGGTSALIGGARVAVARDVAVGPARDPLLLGHRIDVNVQGADVLEGLPGVGPSTAGAILDRRLRSGPFRDVDELSRVRGVGPATLAAVRPLVTVGDVPPREPAGPLDVNTASEADLVGLPGIGPVTAAAIVADRAERGPFAEVSDLDRVRGIGPVTIAAIEGAVVAGAAP